ncbi:hypothetical protein [Macrococcoides canis]|uniref:TcaA protein NTF2-like domain-containing protein n=1 Tax=Macrococcoides canis TaxID=1855823 RepID=A0A4R6C440_9STAP|nr:hypothetical protein [Macrococcus canis]TDM16358.1 hypothetical protein ETI04_08750 [Macrococcus canis]TDM19940.1 hypothetical protein ETI05_09095 [Macrococcus canis]TDM29650.1 hypothetical protein ETI03_09715 [Macrococcus canis]TDM32953.1 hypothetical protein ETI13_10025 [Macrococcus canis]TDM35747.1 hypothetical protein ETI11_10025 [Macrococcus canis]
MKLIKYQWPLIIILLTACSQNTDKTSDVVKQSTTNAQESATIKQTYEVAYKNLAESTIKQLMKKMPDAYNTHQYKLIQPYIKERSEAEKYIKNKMKTDMFDNYHIKSYKTNSIKEDKKHHVHVKVTRIMTSNGTNNVESKVVTVYDLVYNKKHKRMEVYDFNDQSVTPVTKQQAQQVANIEDAIEKVKSAHMARLIKENPDKQVILIAGDDEEDAGGSYFKVKAIDKNSEFLIQTFKVYKHNGLLVGE